MSTIHNNHENLKLAIPHLDDLLKQSSDQQKIITEIMESIFNNAAVVSVSNIIKGDLNV